MTNTASESPDHPAANSRLRWMTVSGHRIRVSVRPAVLAEGQQPRPPLVVCNGIGASLEALAPFVEDVDPSIEVISFDVPGAGGSPAPRLPYRFAMMAHVVGRLVKGLGHDRFDVLGISWGGGLAQQIGLQFPRRCRRVVLVSTATGALMVPAPPWVLAKMFTPRRYRDAGYAKTVAAQLYGGRLRDDPEIVERLLHGETRLGSRRGYVYQLLAGAGWTSLPILPLIRQPVLVLSGDDDPIIPAVNAKLIAALLPDSRLHIFADGHLGLVTSRDVLAPMVSDFLLAEE